MRGRPLSEYERAFADRLGAYRAFAFWKGRVALYAILKGLGIGEGDEVLVPGYTCVMAVNPIVYLKAMPVYVDIDPRSYNVDPNELREKITPRTKLIIAQHTYGLPADLRAIADIANEKGIPFIEDCCLALGSRYDGELTGTFGAAAYFSFQWNKPYTTGLGGMAVVNDRDLADRIAAIVERESQPPSAREVAMLRAQLAVYRLFIYPRTTAMAQTAFRALTRAGLVVGSSDMSEFTPTMAADFFKTMSGVQTRAGKRQLRKLDANIAHRKQMVARYDRLLGERGWPVLLPPQGTDPALVRYPVRVADKTKALATAAGRFVELGSWFESPLHPAETPLEQFGYRNGMCPEAERACREVVNLPVHPRTSEATARRTVDFIADIGPAKP